MAFLIENLKSKILSRRLIRLWRKNHAQRQGRLVRHYFLISVFLVSGGLITSGLVELYFRYQENRD